MRLPLPLRSLAPALLLAATLAACGPTQDAPTATLPAAPAARDSVRQALTTPVPDAASTSQDSAATRSTVTPR